MQPERDHREKLSKLNMSSEAGLTEAPKVPALKLMHVMLFLFLLIIGFGKDSTATHEGSVRL